MAIWPAALFSCYVLPAQSKKKKLSLCHQRATEIALKHFFTFFPTTAATKALPANSKNMSK